MAEDGYVPIATATGSGNPATIDFTGIPAGYGHLVLQGIVGNAASETYGELTVQANADTGTNYCWNRFGMVNGGSIAAHRNDSQPSCYLTQGPGASASTSAYIPFRAYIFGYDNANRYTTFHTHSSYAFSTSYNMNRIWTGLWKDTSTVTSLKLTMAPSVGGFMTISRLSLYGFVK